LSVRVAIVVQRYGREVVGGAELHARQLAGRLMGDLGWEVDVFTTCAKDYRTWANEYPAGEETIDGIRVRRFPTLMRRAAFFGLYDRLTARLIRGARSRGWAKPIGRLLERLWIVLQGPFSPALRRAVEAAAPRYQRLIFFTYLYYPTLATLPRVKERALLVPTAHDEHAFHFQIVERLLRAAPVILANTEPEVALIEPKLVGASASVVAVAGVGFDEARFPFRSPEMVDAARPYLLYLGRICVGKGVDQLLTWFKAWREATGNTSLRLVLAGQREDDVTLPTDGSVDFVGFVDEARKVELLRGATVVVNPSPLESLSMIVIEAMAVGVPLLLNRRCEVFRYYLGQVTTAVGFGDAAEFSRALTDVLATNWGSSQRRDALGTARRWALERFSWKSVLTAFQRYA
jgi:glycosyltransferase involved in cell wall biosynthesis